MWPAESGVTRPSNTSAIQAPPSAFVPSSSQIPLVSSSSSSSSISGATTAAAPPTTNPSPTSSFSSGATATTAAPGASSDSASANAVATSADFVVSPEDSLPETMFLSLPTTPDFMCPVCLCVPTSAKAQEHEVCGRLFCDTCLSQLCTDKHDACPFCTQSLRKNCRSVKEKNLFLFRLLEGLNVRCVNHARGCTYVGEWKHMRTHVERDCTYVPKPCPVIGCKHGISGDSTGVKKHLNDHLHSHILLLQDQITQLTATVKDLESRLTEMPDRQPSGNQVILLLKKSSPTAQRLVADFNCVGQRWQIRIFPEGDSSSDKANCAVYLENLSHTVFEPSVNVSVQLRDMQFKTKTLVGGPKYPFTATNPCWGWSNFSPKKDLPDDNITVLVQFNT